MLKRLLKLLFWIALFCLLLAALCVAHLSTPILPKEGRITIEKGMNLKEIGSRLESQGIIRYRWLFIIYVQLTGKGKSLQAGEYLFDKKVSPLEVADYLVEGWVQVFKVRLLEGWTLHQIADYLSGLSFIKDPSFKAAFLRLAQDQALTESLGIFAATLEGYLFPQTYYLSSKADPFDFLKGFVGEFEKNYQAALQKMKSPPALSKHQIVTLASLIEKETGLKKERPIIASVFYNRLRQRMLLQSDPTIIYGLKNFSGNIRKVDISNPHPYNTYVHPGLPPGPICNPGLASLEAAMEPAQTDYLYFVSKQDGTHYFSRTTKEHAEAVKKYQRGLDTGNPELVE